MSKGLEVEYADDLKEDYGANFVIAKSERKELEIKAKWYDLIIKKRVDINNDIFYCRNYNHYLAEKENDAVDEMMLTIEEWCKLKEIVGGVE